MNTWEKFCSLTAVVFALALVAILLIFPEARQFNRLLAIGLAGIVVNVILMFVVLRDIFLRRFHNPNMRFVWIGLVLFFWPSIVYYLFRHGFHPRD